MKIVVIGGTGLIGSKLVNKLSQAGHTVTAASPQSGVNTLTGEGLAETLKDADVVVDVSNSPSFEDQAVMDFFQRSTTNLLRAEADANVKVHVALSVVGSDRLASSGYLKAKLAQERLIRESGRPYSILRSTQFFEFADRIAIEGTKGNEVRISTGAVQPIAADETVAALADVVVSPAVNGIVEVGGPERMPMSEFIRYYLNAMEDSRQLIPDAHALYFGEELDETSLVTGDNARIGKIRYEQWLKAKLVKQT